MRGRPPAEVRRRAGDDRVLAWHASGTSSLVAAENALLLPEGYEPAAIPWDLVLHVTWAPGSVDVSAQDRPGSRPVVHRIPVTGEPGELAELAQAVRERVNASIVVQHHAPLVGERGARFVARRRPGSDELRWSVVFDTGLDASDPALRDQADEALAALRASLGV